MQGNEEHYRRLERMYESAPINEYFRPKLTVSEAAAEIVIAVRLFVLTASFHLYLTRPVSKGVLTAHGRVVDRSRNLFIAESELVDGDGRPVGRGSGAFARSKIPLGPEVGYI